MNIVFVGTSGFPYRKEASVSRLRTIAQMMASAGGQVTVLNRLAVATPSDDGPGTIDGVDTIEVSGSRYRNPRFLIRNAKKLFAPFLEWMHLLRLHRRHGIDVLHVYTQEFIPVAFYALFAKLFGIRLLGHYVEMRSQIVISKSRIQRLNDQLLDGKFLRVSDGFIAISTLLENHIMKTAPGRPIMKMPPVCDFAWFDGVSRHIDDAPYFVYCGSAAYGEVVEFILDCWESIAARDGHRLFLVLSGTEDQMQRLRQRSDSIGDVKIYSKLPYERLVAIYKGARGLLIPLRPTIQDQARFPQKCCEYLASGGLVITTNIGEMSTYFKDGENALVAEAYEVKAYSDKIRTAIEESKVCEAVAERGYQRGRRTFDSCAQTRALEAFLHSSW